MKTYVDKFVIVRWDINKDSATSFFRKGEIGIVIQYNPDHHFNCTIQSLDGNRTSVGNVTYEDKEGKLNPHFHIVEVPDKTIRILYGK